MDASNLLLVHSLQDLPSGTIIPRSKDGASAKHFGNRDTLAFTTRHTTHEGVTDDGVGSVLDVEHRQEQVVDIVLELLVGHAIDTSVWGLGGESKADSLGDGEGGQVVIVFRRVYRQLCL